MAEESECFFWCWQKQDFVALSCTDVRFHRPQLEEGAGHSCSFTILLGASAVVRKGFCSDLALPDRSLPPIPSLGAATSPMPDAVPEAFSPAPWPRLRFQVLCKSLGGQGIRNAHTKTRIIETTTVSKKIAVRRYGMREGAAFCSKLPAVSAE